MHMKIIYILLALVLSNPAFAQDSNFEYVAFIMCAGNPRIPVASCMIDKDQHINHSNLDLTNFGQRNFYSYTTINQAGQLSTAGLGMRLSKNFNLSIRNMSRNQMLTISIFRKDDQFNPVMKQDASYGQTISLSQ